jgi:hypothetical protein
LVSPLRKQQMGDLLTKHDRILGVGRRTRHPAPGSIIWQYDSLKLD